MKLSTNNGAFEFNLSGGKATVKLNLKRFSGQLTINELPPQLAKFQERLAYIATEVQNIASDIHNSLKTKEDNEGKTDAEG